MCKEPGSIRAVELAFAISLLLQGQQFDVSIELYLLSADCATMRFFFNLGVQVKSFVFHTFHFKYQFP